MPASAVQELKLEILAATGLSREAWHVLIGLAAHLITCVLYRRPLSWRGGLIGALTVALVLEIPDLRDNYVYLGRFRWAASLKDVMHSLLAPSMLVLAQLAAALRPRFESWASKGDAGVPRNVDRGAQ